MSKRRDQDSWASSMTDEGRLLIRLLKDAILYEWVECESGRTLKFLHLSRSGEFSEAMMRYDDRGYAAGAKFFMGAVVETGLERAVCSNLLTKMAGSHHDQLNNGHDAPVFEREVSFFGRFVRHLQQELPQNVIDWTEDLNTDDPWHDLKSQTTEFIRGVLFSPAIEQRRCLSFWEGAARAKRFPLRIFSDPCDARDGVIFSSYHSRVIGAVFSLVSSIALERLVCHMRECATHKFFLRSVGDGKWERLRVAVMEHERLAVFKSIVSHIDSVSRQQEVAELLGISAAC